MVINKGELIICKNHSELATLSSILEENGYKMLDPRYDPISKCLDKRACVGLRWLPSHSFPSCIAHTSKEQLDKYNENNKIEDGSDWYRPICITYEDFYERLYGKEIDITDMV